MPITVGHDTAKTRKTLSDGDQSIAYYSLPAATEAGLGDFSKLPAALKVVLENMLRFEDDKTVTVDDIKAFAEWGAQVGKIHAKSDTALHACFCKTLPVFQP